MKQIKHTVNFFEAPDWLRRAREPDDGFYISDLWKKQRAERLLIDNNICQLCKGKFENNTLHIHHIYGKHSEIYKNDDAIKYLITLCETCHSFIHETKMAYSARELLQKKADVNYNAYMRVKEADDLIAYLEPYDQMNGGKYNLSSLDDIKQLEQDGLLKNPLYMTIRDEFAHLKRLEINKYIISGYSDKQIREITGFSQNLINRTKDYLYSKNNNNIGWRRKFMKKINLTNVEDVAEGSTQLPAGAYICKYTKIEDVANKEYLKLEFDIAEGEFKDYFKSMQERLKADWWGGRYIRSYKEKALPFFKRMCAAVMRCNNNFIFDGEQNSDEQTLVGKTIVLVIGYEEYISNSGDVKQRIFVDRELSMDDFKNKKFKIPALKELPDDKKDEIADRAMVNTTTEAFMETAAGLGEELPF